MKAMIFAAGLGTRLKPFTENHPKALFSINGKTLLQRNIEYLKMCGIQEMVINIHHFGEQITQFLKENDYFDCTFHISDESDELLETGGGLLKAREFLQDDDFVLVNADILTKLNLLDMIQHHQQHQPLATLAVSDRKSSRKLMFDENMKLCGWKNLTTGEEIITDSQVYKITAFTGIHILSKTIFEGITETGKFSIMQSYMRMMKEQSILGYLHDEIVVDVGKPEAVSVAEEYFK